MCFLQEFFREPLPRCSGAPLDEIYLPATSKIVTAPSTAVSNREPFQKNKSQPPCMPLPPPPFALADHRKSVRSFVVKDNAPFNKGNDSYMVDTGPPGELNRVKLLRVKEDRSVEKIPTSCSSTGSPKSAPRVSPEASPKPSPKRKASPVSAKTKKPRKKWLPSLGPPETESLRILARAASQGTWYCDNPELFSAIATLSKQ